MLGRTRAVASWVVVVAAALAVSHAQGVRTPITDALRWSLRVRTESGAAGAAGMAASVPSRGERGPRVDRILVRDAAVAGVWRDAGTGAAVRITHRSEPRPSGARWSIDRFEVLALPPRLELLMEVSVGLSSEPRAAKRRGAEILVNGAPLGLDAGEVMHTLLLARDEATEIWFASAR
jgi:hypothetical protein